MVCAAEIYREENRDRNTASSWLGIIAKLFLLQPITNPEEVSKQASINICKESVVRCLRMPRMFRSAL